MRARSPTVNFYPEQIQGSQGKAAPQLNHHPPKPAQQQPVSGQGTAPAADHARRHVPAPCAAFPGIRDPAKTSSAFPHAGSRGAQVQMIPETALCPSDLALPLYHEFDQNQSQHNVKILSHMQNKCLVFFYAFMDELPVLRVCPTNFKFGLVFSLKAKYPPSHKQKAYGLLQPLQHETLRSFIAV